LGDVNLMMLNPRTMQSVQARLHSDVQRREFPQPSFLLTLHALQMVQEEDSLPKPPVEFWAA
jgi:hypothetical protein